MYRMLSSLSLCGCTATTTLARARPTSLVLAVAKTNFFCGYDQHAFHKRTLFNDTSPHKMLLAGRNFNLLKHHPITTYSPLLYTSASETTSNTQPLDQSSKWLTIPNALTMSRICLAPYLGYLVLSHNYPWALGLFILAGATDSLDGWIARNVPGQASVIGSYIDPVADKILISVLTFSLTMVDMIPVWLCGMIILRDVLIVLTSSHFHYKHIPPPKTLSKFLDFESSPVKMEPTQISKYNTFLQLGLVTASIGAPIFSLSDHYLLQSYWYLVAVTTVVSGCSYFVKDKSAYIR